MRVCVSPVPKLGIAMRRTAEALARTAPHGITIVEQPTDADIQVLHAVDQRVLKHRQSPQYAVMMHCLDFMADPSGNGDNVPIPQPELWEPVWKDALVVWAYYSGIPERYEWFSTMSSWQSKNEHVKGSAGPHFYYSPLGVDGDIFKKKVTERDNLILTTGYVSGPRAEAIEECALAAAAAGGKAVHLGPSEVGGMTQRPTEWRAVTGITDAELNALYNKTRYVSGLRHGEGFELPILEGLASGCRPICFDLPAYREWFSNHAIFVPESHGEELIGYLTQILKRPPAPVQPRERDAVLESFDWNAIGRGFWRALLKQLAARAEAGGGSLRMLEPVPLAGQSLVSLSQPSMETVQRLRTILKDNGGSMPNISVVGGKKRSVVWIGDSPSTDWTGFGRASRYILDEVRKDFDVTVIGTTYDGCPYDREKMPYDIWPLNAGIGEVISKVKPAAVVIQHDPWITKGFLEQTGNVPVIAALAVDGKNCRMDYLNGLDMAIFWTEFGLSEARVGGFAGPAKVVPLGVDLDIYNPRDSDQDRKAAKKTALAQIGYAPTDELVNGFIVGNICRNQPRKRLDLTVRHFSEWVKSRGINDAYLYVQCGPTGEQSYDVSGLMEYERLSNRLLYVEQGYRRVHPEGRLAFVYRALDLFWSTTQGEGFGLPALEAMACGTPCALPDWSGYGDWASPAAHLVRCGDVSGTLNWPGNPRSGIRIGVLGGVPALEDDIEALDKIYRDATYRQELRERGLKLAGEQRFRWPEIGQAYSKAIMEVLDGPIRMSATR